MAIYITGDIHGNPERLSNKKLKPFGIELGADDIVIICGDFGMPWHDENEYWLQWLAEKPFTTLFVDGNHENYDLLYSYPVETLYGGKVHRLEDNIFHLMRGEVFNIDGLTFFAFGGATSTDKVRRTEHISWWPQENFSLAEFDNAIENLEKINFTVDYVITHTAPKRFLESAPTAVDRVMECKTSIMLSDLEPLINYKHWFFGHFHADYHREASVCSWMYEEVLPLNLERKVYWCIDPSTYGEVIRFYKSFDECTAKKYFYGQGEKSNRWYKVCCKESAVIDESKEKQHHKNFIIRPLNRKLEGILNEEKNSDMNFNNFKYNPADYPYPLNEDMEKVYKAYKEHNTSYLECYIADLHLTLKQAGVAHVLSSNTVKEMQKYFWSLLNDFDLNGCSKNGSKKP